MVKLFIGNVPPAATQEELRSLFEQYGKVTDCDIISNYAFVHMDVKKEADEAIRNLKQYKLHGVSINVEHSRGKPKATTKLHVSSLSPDITCDELREKFEEYGSVMECDIVKDYAFVHMAKAEEALDAIRHLNNYEMKGKKMHVQLSTSRLRVTPGMGEESRCYRCGKDGHWSGVCPIDQMAEELDSQYGSYSGYGPMRSAAAAYAERVLYDERSRLIDYYQRYRARPSSFDAYMERRLPALPPSVSSLSQRKRVESYPYERHVLPPPSSASSYYTRERSPLRRSSTSAATEGYGTEQGLSSTARSSVYDSSRFTRESYERSGYY